MWPQHTQTSLSTPCLFLSLSLPNVQSSLVSSFVTFLYDYIRPPLGIAQSSSSSYSFRWLHGQRLEFWLQTTHSEESSAVVTPWLPATRSAEQKKARRKESRREVGNLLVLWAQEKLQAYTISSSQQTVSYFLFSHSTFLVGTGPDFSFFPHWFTVSCWPSFFFCWHLSLLSVALTLPSCFSFCLPLFYVLVPIATQSAVTRFTGKIKINLLLFLWPTFVLDKEKQ